MHLGQCVDANAVTFVGESIQHWIRILEKGGNWQIQKGAEREINESVGVWFECDNITAT